MAERSAVNDLLSDLVPADEVDRFPSPVEARKKAMDYLARREHAATELVRKLVTAGFDANVSLAAVEQLGDEGLQDDRRFVEGFVHSRIGQGKGPTRIRAELGQRGIDEGLVDDVLDAAGQDWLALAGDVRRKKFGRARPRDFAEKARQMRFLQYRGFDAETCRAAVEAG